MESVELAFSRPDRASSKILRYISVGVFSLVFSSSRQAVRSMQARSRTIVCRKQVSVKVRFTSSGRSPSNLATGSKSCREF